MDERGRSRPTASNGVAEARAIPRFTFSAWRSPSAMLDLEVLHDPPEWPNLLPIVDGSWRCHPALVKLIENAPTPPEWILHREEPARMALLIWQRLSRLSELPGRAHGVV